MLLNYRGAQYEKPESELPVHDLGLKGKYRGVVTFIRHGEANRQKSSQLRYRGASYQ